MNVDAKFRHEYHARRITDQARDLCDERTGTHGAEQYHCAQNVSRIETSIAIEVEMPDLGPTN